MLVWDNVRIHLTASLRAFFAANTSWLTVFQLPPYAPDLKTLQYRPQVIDGCLSGTGIGLEN